jgi:hypothetical protein
VRPRTAVIPGSKYKTVFLIQLNHLNVFYGKNPDWRKGQEKVIDFFGLLGGDRKNLST